MSPEFKAAFDNMVSAINKERSLEWKQTSKKAALQHIKMLVDVIQKGNAGSTDGEGSEAVPDSGPDGDVRDTQRPKPPP